MRGEVPSNYPVQINFEGGGSQNIAIMLGRFFVCCRLFRWFVCAFMWVYVFGGWVVCMLGQTVLFGSVGLFPCLLVGTLFSIVACVGLFWSLRCSLARLFVGSFVCCFGVCCCVGHWFFRSFVS